MTDLATGTVVAERYRLDRLLGEGGMGAVWSATHEITGGRVALKFLKSANVPRAEARKRFVREARASALLDHPNVVQIRDVIDHEDTPVLVMDLLHGETLAKRLEAQGRLDLGETARIALQIVAAIGAAHEAGLIHRDLKPENVFLSRVPGVGEVVRVLDFGIAKLIDEGVDGTTVTQSGTLLGTPAYMAPEQVFGERELDYRVDVWALGVILHELLAGVRPIEGENYGQIAKKLLSEPVRSIAEFRADLPVDVIVLVDHLLVRDRRDRHGDLREVVEVLAKHTTAQRPSFGPPRPPRASFDSGPTSTPAPASASDRIYQPGTREHDPEAATLAASGRPALETGVSHVTPRRPPPRPARPATLAAFVGALVLVGGLGVGVRSWLSRESSASPAAPTLVVPAPRALAVAETSAAAPLPRPPMKAIALTSILSPTPAPSSTPKPSPTPTPTPTSTTKLAVGTPPRAATSAVRTPPIASSAKPTAPSASATKKPNDDPNAPNIF